MKSKYVFILIGLALALVVAAVGYILYQRKAQVQEGEIPHMYTTDHGEYYEAETPHADPLIVGKWQNSRNPQWYKVYYDDWDEDNQMFWGKEWNEAEDIQEEDMHYHGNGWFRWEKKGKAIHEYATMDSRDMQIHRNYKLLKLTGDSLVYNEPDHKKILFRFSRVK